MCRFLYQHLQLEYRRSTAETELAPLAQSVERIHGKEKSWGYSPRPVTQRVWDWRRVADEGVESSRGRSVVVWACLAWLRQWCRCRPAAAGNVRSGRARRP